MKPNIIFGCLALLYSSLTFAAVEVGEKPFLAKFNFEKDKVVLEIVDSVKDGCLPRPQSVLDVFEVELRRLGINATQSGSGLSMNYVVRIVLVGNTVKTENGSEAGCVVAVVTDFRASTHAQIVETNDELNSTIPTLWIDFQELVGPKSYMQRDLEELAREEASNLYLQMSGAIE